MRIIIRKSNQVEKRGVDFFKEAVLTKCIFLRMVEKYIERAKMFIV
jgi:hypothetical protein